VRIIADDAIPFLEETFGSLGDLVAMPANGISPDAVRDADMVVVRTKTEIDQNLLENSSVRFVASATAGIDHVDTEYLKERDIAFAYSPGCNANAVAEYVIAALLSLAVDRGFDLSKRTLGVIGLGNVGSRVAQKARTLGMIVLENDPPLERETGEDRFVPFEVALQADIVTLHVPLSNEGEDATRHLIDDKVLQIMRRGAILVNTSRGPVVSNSALNDAVKSEVLSDIILDVWEGEPDIDLNLLDLAFLATPHIAGYSMEGKLNAVTMAYGAACAFLKVTPKNFSPHFSSSLEISTAP